MRSSRKQQQQQQQQQQRQRQQQQGGGEPQRVAGPQLPGAAAPARPPAPNPAMRGGWRTALTSWLRDASEAGPHEPLGHAPKLRPRRRRDAPGPAPAAAPGPPPQQQPIGPMLPGRRGAA
jgi:hypothetical protein